MVKRVIVVSLLWRISSVEGSSIIMIQRPPIAQPGNKVRVSNVVPSHGDNIGLLVLDLRQRVVAVEISAGQECNSGGLENFAEDIEGVGLLALSRCALWIAIHERGQLFLLVEHLVEARLDPAYSLVFLFSPLPTGDLHMNIDRSLGLRQLGDTLAQV